MISASWHCCQDHGVTASMSDGCNHVRLLVFFLADVYSSNSKCRLEMLREKIRALYL